MTPAARVVYVIFKDHEFTSHDLPKGCVPVDSREDSTRPVWLLQSRVQKTVGCLRLHRPLLSSRVPSPPAARYSDVRDSGKGKGLGLVYGPAHEDMDLRSHGPEGADVTRFAWWERYSSAIFTTSKRYGK